MSSISLNPFPSPSTIGRKPLSTYEKQHTDRKSIVDYVDNSTPGSTIYMPVQKYKKNLWDRVDTLKRHSRCALQRPSVCRLYVTCIVATVCLTEKLSEEANRKWLMGIEWSRDR